MSLRITVISNEVRDLRFLGFAWKWQVVVHGFIGAQTI